MRLFVGIALDTMARGDLERVSHGLRGARWISSENLHLTLRFVGDVEGGAAEDLDAALAAVSAPPFDLAFAGVGTFDRRGKAHTVWAAVAAAPALLPLRDKVETAVKRAGFPPDGRKFKPHVTVARLRDMPMRHVGPWIEANGAFAGGPYSVDRFILFRSHLGRGGAHYEALAEYPLDAVGN